MLTTICPLHYTPQVWPTSKNIACPQHIRSLLTKSTSSLLHLPAQPCAVLRDISIGTSYQIVRLVFRPYTHFTSSSWTSEWLRSSIRISSDFNQNKYSSLSFGSYHTNSLFYFGYSLQRPHLASLEISLVRVSIRVLSNRLPPPVLSLFHSLQRHFFIFPSRYFYPIGLSLYLALDASTTSSCCTTKQHYSISTAITNTGYHRLWLSFPWHPSVLSNYNSLTDYHQSSFLFVRHYYRNPCLFLFLSLLICLSSERPHTHRASLESAPIFYTNALSLSVAFFIANWT